MRNVGSGDSWLSGWARAWPGACVWPLPADRQLPMVRDLKSRTPLCGFVTRQPTRYPYPQLKSPPSPPPCSFQTPQIPALSACTTTCEQHLTETYRDFIVILAFSPSYNYERQIFRQRGPSRLPTNPKEVPMSPSRFRLFWFSWLNLLPGPLPSAFCLPRKVYCAERTIL